MASTNRVFVSPGVYTSEKDISYVTKQIGVTTLGLAGETTKGPAFQPIFISNYDEFKSFFGGQNATKVKETGIVKYELPYIAKSYLTKSNQLYVTRALGFSGYDAGESWSITSTGTDNNKVIATLRSRAAYGGDEILDFKVSGATELEISGAISGATDDFILSGYTGGDAINAFSYTVSFDPTNKNYITRVLGTSVEGKAPIFVDEFYSDMFNDAVAVSGFTGLSQTLISDDDFSNYKVEYSPAVSPYVVSEVQGDVIKKLFRFITISDGNSANKEIKVSISNIKPDSKEFDLQIRAFYDTDANPVFVEK